MERIVKAHIQNRRFVLIEPIQLPEPVVEIIRRLLLGDEPASLPEEAVVELYLDDARWTCEDELDEELVALDLGLAISQAEVEAGLTIDVADVMAELRSHR